MENFADVGSDSLLDALLATQRADEALSNHDRLISHADALIALSATLDHPVVWGVGVAAERLIGAAIVRSAGGVRAHKWCSDVEGERVLLVTGHAVTPLALVDAAHHAKRLGATEVHACGVNVEGLAPVAGRPFDFQQLAPADAQDSEHREIPLVLSSA